MRLWDGVKRRMGSQESGKPVQTESGGFTLIEVCLALALSALLLVAVYWTYFNISRTIDAAQEAQEALETGRMLSEMLKRDIRGMITDRFSLKGKNQTVDGRPLGQVEFVTTGGFYNEPLKLRRIGYELVVNDKGEYILLREESNDLNDLLGTTTPPAVFELSKIVRTFRLEFYNGTNWSDSWDSDAAGALPQQIRVTFDVLDTKGKERNFAAEESIQSATQ